MNYDSCRIVDPNYTAAAAPATVRGGVCCWELMNHAGRRRRRLYTPGLQAGWKLETATLVNLPTSPREHAFTWVAKTTIN
jgi:hypothetical protein